MKDYNEKVKSIERIIKRGYIRHDIINPALTEAGLSQIKPDDVSELVSIHKYKGGWWENNKLGSWIKGILDKIFSYTSAILGAAIVAEIVAARKFADSIIGDQLKGFGDHFLYWLGLKKIEVSGPDMMMAIMKMTSATLDIVKGMAIGMVLGYLLWKAITKLIGYEIRKNKRKRDVMRLLDRYEKTDNAES